MSDVQTEAVVDNKFAVVVIYNGVHKSIRVHDDELVKALLERAIREFGNLPNPHTLSLFNEAGQELNDNQTLKQAGVRPGNKLLLRPSAVKGGC